MNVLILMASPRAVSNTAELCKHFMEEMQGMGAQIRYVTLADKDIRPCKACYACQHVEGSYGCALKDDMYKIVDDIIWADLIVLAAPIYAWFCPSTMKVVLDRHYGLNKYYGSAKGSLWEGKKVAIIATHGYEADYATSPFEVAVQRLCIHSKLHYMGIYSVQDEDDLASFQTEEAIAGAKAFARKMME